MGNYYLNSNGIKTYMPSLPQGSRVNGYVFTDSTGGNRYVLNSDGTRSYLTLTSASGNTEIYTDRQTGSRYTLTRDPATNNTYTILSGNVREYLTGFPQQTSGAPVTFTDALGTNYAIYSDPQNNKYVQYFDPYGAYYLNSTGGKVYAPLSQTGNVGFGSNSQLIFTDSTGSQRYILASNGSRVYLTLSSTSGNTQTFTDPQNNRYTVARDPANNNLYTVINSGTREYLTSFPQTVAGAPSTLVDNLGTQYGVYTDPQGSKYVTYTDPNGVYYINSNGIKTYFPSSSPSAPANTGLNPVNIYIDSTGGNRYLLNNNGVRTYLTFVSATGNTQVYADPMNNKYTIYSDPATGNQYTLTSSGTRTYLTSYPASTSGSPTNFNDSVETQYSIVSDPQNNRYVTYSDPSGRYYLNAKGEKVYLPGTASVSLATPTWVYLDKSGNKFVLDTKGNRVYLHPVSQSGTT